MHPNNDYVKSTSSCCLSLLLPRVTAICRSSTTGLLDPTKFKFLPAQPCVKEATFFDVRLSSLPSYTNINTFLYFNSLNCILFAFLIVINTGLLHVRHSVPFNRVVGASTVRSSYNTRPAFHWLCIVRLPFVLLLPLCVTKIALL